MRGQVIGELDGRFVVAAPGTHGVCSACHENTSLLISFTLAPVKAQTVSPVSCGLFCVRCIRCTCNSTHLRIYGDKQLVGPLSILVDFQTETFTGFPSPVEPTPCFPQALA